MIYVDHVTGIRRSRDNYTGSRGRGLNLQRTTGGEDEQGCNVDTFIIQEQPQKPHDRLLTCTILMRCT